MDRSEKVDSVRGVLADCAHQKGGGLTIRELLLQVCDSDGGSGSVHFHWGALMLA